MSSEFERRAIEEALRRRTQATDPNLEKFLNAQSDWYVTCPKCNIPLHGTLAEIKAHNCGK